MLLPTSGPFVDRLAASARNPAAKSHQRGTSTALLSPLFRVLAAIGIYQRFIDHQRLIHTLSATSRDRTPPSRFSLYPITGIIPLAVATGNVTVAFTALSYTGSLVITISATRTRAPILTASSRGCSAS